MASNGGGGGGGDAASEVSYESAPSEGGFEPASERGRDPLPRIISSSHSVQVFRRLAQLDGTFCCRASSPETTGTDAARAHLAAQGLKGLKPHDPAAGLPERILRFDGAMEAWLEELPLPSPPPRHLPLPFASLNDAANLVMPPGGADLSLLRLGNSRATIWYFTVEFLQQLWPLFLDKDDAGLRLWERALLDRGCTIQSTHVEVGRVHYEAKNAKQRASWLKSLFAAMQAPSWSPAGEARALLSKRRLTHASMSIGDAVQIGSELYVAGLTGFVAVSEASALLPPGTVPEIPELAEQLKAFDEKEGSEAGSGVQQTSGRKSKKNGEGRKDAKPSASPDDGGESVEGGKKKGKGKGKGKTKDKDKDKANDENAGEKKEKKGRKKEKKGVGPAQKKAEAGAANGAAGGAAVGAAVTDRADRRGLRAKLQAEREKVQGGR